MSYVRWYILAMTLLLVGCKKKENTTSLDNLSLIKNAFIESSCQEEVNESPFHLNYSFRTVLFSKDVVSFFGEMLVYDHLPHGWSRYEGKTFYRSNGKLQEVLLSDLFTTADQKEFLRKVCENRLKENPFSYFCGENPLRTHLEIKDLTTFVIDDHSLIVIFQPYTVMGCVDEPPHVQIPYEVLKDHWNPKNPLNLFFPIKIFTASWMQDDFYTDLE